MILLDTHALVWWVSDPSKLSARAKRAIASALRLGPIATSAISIFEIATAVRRGRLAFTTPLEQWLSDLLSLPELRVEPVTSEIARAAGAFPDAMPGDPADRIIAATAISLEAKLVTADARLRTASSIPSVW